MVHTQDLNVTSAFGGMMRVGQWGGSYRGEAKPPTLNSTLQAGVPPGEIGLLSWGYFGSDKGSLPSEMCNEI